MLYATDRIMNKEIVRCYFLMLCLGQLELTEPKACNVALGMENGLIKLSQLSAKGGFSTYDANSARYNGPSAWCTEKYSGGYFFENSFYLQIDLLKDYQVTSISLQGNGQHKIYSYGPTYKLMFRSSAPGAQFQYVRDSNGSSVLKSNTVAESESVVFKPPLCARYLKYVPFASSNHKCIRLELYGCPKCSEITSTHALPPTKTVPVTTSSTDSSDKDKSKKSRIKLVIVVLVILLILIVVLIVLLRYRRRIRSWCENRKTKYHHPNSEKPDSCKKDKKPKFHVQYDVTYSDVINKEGADSPTMPLQKSENHNSDQSNENCSYTEVYAAPIIFDPTKNDNASSPSKQIEPKSQYEEMSDAVNHVYSPCINNVPQSYDTKPNPIYEGSEIYEDPYQSITGSILYADPNSFDDRNPLTVREFPRNQLQFVEKIGQGQFGEVYICEVDGLVNFVEGEKRFSCVNTGSNKVAVKMLKSGTDKSVEEEFMKELRVMSRLEHENLVQLIGVCYEQPKCMVVEYMENGDLMQFLQGFERYQGSPDPRISELPSNVLLNDTLLHIAMQIAAGMNYLSTQGFVHRDLATRNCLVGHAFTVKIADFGMSRCLYTKQYYRIEGKAVLPIRWMAPESLYYGTFTSQSDVWAFAVTVWEIFMFVKQAPYEHLSDKQVIENACIYIQDKSKAFKYLHQPPGCLDDVYSMLLRCWQNSPETRPEFSDLLEFFKSQHIASVEVRI